MIKTHSIQNQSKINCKQFLQAIRAFNSNILLITIREKRNHSKGFYEPLSNKSFQLILATYYQRNYFRHYILTTIRDIQNNHYKPLPGKLLPSMLTRVYHRIPNSSSCLETIYYSQFPPEILKYWVGVQWGQSYLMGRRCLFSLGWPAFQ